MNVKDDLQSLTGLSERMQMIERDAKMFVHQCMCRLGHVIGFLNKAE